MRSIMRNAMKKSPGNAGEFAITGLCILVMSAIMILYMQCAGIIQKKIQTSQIARKYLLKMETCGCLLPEDFAGLMEELNELGISELDFSGTSFAAVGYGQTINLNIKGKVKGEYEIIEYRTSTAKY